MRALILIFILLLAAADQRVVAAEPPTWIGHNQAYQVEWTPQDITATRLADHQRVFSMRTFSARQLDLSMRQETSAAGALLREKKVTVVSLLGSLLALKDDTFDDFQPAAHPSERVRYWTIDLAAPAKDGFDPSDQYGAAVGAEERGRIRSLDQLFPAATIYNALAHDKIVLAEVSQPPRELDDLITAWRDQSNNADATALVGKSASPPAPCYDVPEDVLTSFAILGKSGTGLAVRLGLPGTGACHASFTQIGLVLPTPGDLAHSASEAVSPPAGLSPLRISVTRRLQ